MATPDLYTIRSSESGKDEKLQLGQIVKRCEAIATGNRDAFFVGRETIRGRLRCGIRTWEGLTSPVASRKARVANHTWRQGVGAAPARRHRTFADDGVYEPEDYVGPDESLDRLLGRE